MQNRLNEEPIEKKPIGAQRKKYRIATGILAGLLVVFAALAVVFSVFAVNDYFHMTARRKDISELETAGGYTAVAEKITELQAQEAAAQAQIDELNPTKTDTDTALETAKQRYQALQQENEELSQASDADKYTALDNNYTSLKEKYSTLQSDYKKLQEQKKNEQSSTQTGTGSDETESSGEKVAYLTFDDGLSSNTTKILDTLAKYDAKATFFVNGCNGHYDLYSRIVNEGHTLGNHTYSHEWGSVYKNPTSFREEVEKVNNIIKEKTGVTPTIFRFPGGSSTTKCGNELRTDSAWQNTASQPHKMMFAAMDVLNDLGMKYFDWNVSCGDASGVSYTSQQLVNNVMNEVGSKKTVIILMHEKAVTAGALPGIIEGLKNKGYTLKAITSSTPTYQFLSK